MISAGQGKSIKQVDTPVEVDDDINAKSWGLAVKGGSTDTVDDLSSAEEALPDNSGEESGYIWYLCYGSNMWKPRFMCYISGGQVCAFISVWTHMKFPKANGMSEW